MSKREAAEARGGRDAGGGTDEAPDEVFLCIQCRKCTAGCPVAEAADLPVHELMARVRLGDLERATRSRMIWDCLGCHACSTRCPAGADPAELLDRLRARALELGLAPSSRAGTFHAAFLRRLRRKGRSNEMRLMLRIYLKHWLTWQELRRGLAMRGKGRARLLGRSIRARRDLRRVFDLAQGSQGR